MRSASLNILEEVSEVIQNADEYAAVGKALVPAGKELIDKFRPLLTDIFKALGQTVLDVVEELEPELARASTIKAARLHRTYKAYQKAGFTPSEAFALVLASVKPVNFSEALSKVQQHQRSSSK